MIGKKEIQKILTNCYSVDLHLSKNKIVKTYVYSDEYGKDIVARFKPNKVSNIKRIDEPLDNTVL